MLTQVILKEEEREIVLEFDPKNQGKFRLKELKQGEITSTYNKVLNRKNINNTEWYLEWQISYYVDTSKIVCDGGGYFLKSGEKKIKIPEGILLKEVSVLLPDGKSVYPFELPVLFYHGLNLALLPKESKEDLVEWISEIQEEEFLDNKLKPTIGRKFQSITVKDMKFASAQVELPLIVYKNPDGTWVEIIWQKQQNAYSFQPMVYLCIPHRVLGNNYRWIINSDNAKVLSDLLKIFALTSERHRLDILKILNSLSVA